MCKLLFFRFFYKGKDDTVHHPVHLAAVAVDEQNPRHQNRSAQSDLKDPTKRAHVPGHLTKILLEMSVKKPNGKLGISSGNLP